MRAFLLIFVILFAVPAWAEDTTAVDAVAASGYVNDSVITKVDVTAGTTNNMLGEYNVDGTMTVETPVLPETLVLEETEETTA